MDLSSGLENHFELLRAETISGMDLGKGMGVCFIKFEFWSVESFHLSFESLREFG